MNKSILIQLFLFVFLIVFNVQETETCNEAVCASIVSKCMLTQSCKCDLKNCSCCKDCFQCLSYLYSECCSCVEMCPKPNDTSNILSKKSHVEDFEFPIPELFQALTLEPDSLQRWKIFTYPVDYDLSSYLPASKFENDILVKNEQEVAPRKDIITLNCTVAYMSQCMSWQKCKTSCQSTGASKYRWFHDGCCQCIGNTCISYGINESRCLECPLSKEETSIEDKASLYYDETQYEFDEKNLQSSDPAHTSV